MNRSSQQISKQDLVKWCSIPADRLASYPGRKANLIIDRNQESLHEILCDALVQELLEHNAAGKPTRWILPCHAGMFDPLVRRINAERISLKNLHIFHMDDFLDWQGRPLPVKASFTSCRGIMQSQLYDRILSELNVPQTQRHFPDVRNPDALDEAIIRAGGVDTLVGGVGCKGMVAFCEAPRSAYQRITMEEYAHSKTRIIQIHEDTIVAYAEREFGGCYDAVPPMAITIGMASMLKAQRAFFVVATGAWKQTVIRVAMLSEPTLEYPVTLITNAMPCTILTNEASADHVLSHMLPPDSLIQEEVVE